MFEELWADVDRSQGGLWWNNDTSAMVEVIDLDSAAGVDGATLIEEGDAHITAERIYAGGGPAGHSEEIRNQMAEAWEWWDEEGGIFEVLPLQIQERILQGVEAVHAGFHFDVDRKFLVVDSSYRESAERAEELAEEWGAFDWSVVDNPDLEIRGILRERFEIDDDAVPRRRGPSRKDWVPGTKPE